MKSLVNYFLIAAAAIALASCAPRFFQEAYFVNYQNAGGGKVFLSESNSVAFDYTPIGSILVEEVEGKFEIKSNLTARELYKKSDPIFDDTDEDTKTVWRKPNAESALDFAANKALEMGGDGIINLKMQPSIYDGKRKSLIVTGMVIKRK